MMSDSQNDPEFDKPKPAESKFATSLPTVERIEYSEPNPQEFSIYNHIFFGSIAFGINLLTLIIGLFTPWTLNERELIYKLFILASVQIAALSCLGLSLLFALRVVFRVLTQLLESSDASKSS